MLEILMLLWEWRAGCTHPLQSSEQVEVAHKHLCWALHHFYTSASAGSLGHVSGRSTLRQDLALQLDLI